MVGPNHMTNDSLGESQRAILKTTFNHPPLDPQNKTLKVVNSVHVHNAHHWEMTIFILPINVSTY